MMESRGNNKQSINRGRAQGYSTEPSNLALTCIHSFFFFFHISSLLPVNQFNIIYYYYDLIILAVIDRKKWEMMLMDRFIQIGFSPIPYGNTLQTVTILYNMQIHGDVTSFSRRKWSENQRSTVIGQE